MPQSVKKRNLISKLCKQKLNSRCPQHTNHFNGLFQANLGWLATLLILTVQTYLVVVVMHLSVYCILNNICQQ